MSEMMEIWEQFVRDAPRLEAQLRPWIQNEVYKKIRDLREGQDFLTHVDISVIVPICSDCTYSYYRAIEESMPPPDVFGVSWERDYAWLGVPRRKIEHTARALKEGWWHLECRRCGSDINLDQGGSFYVERESLTWYFGFGEAQGDRVPVAMKTAVLSLFGSTCAGCQKVLSPHEATMDHLVAVSKGGLTEVPNLQVLCEPCNQAKADQEVKTVEIVLDFLLRAPPSDAFEGVIW